MARRKSLRLSTAVAAFAALAIWIGSAQGPAEAPAGYDTPIYNTGSSPQGNGMPLATNETLADDMATFMEEDDITGGLGPVYNARGCVDCHANPVVGGGSIVSELRVGHHDAHGNFVNPTILINDGATAISNRSLVNDRAICPQAQERVPGTETIHALRATTSTLGEGFVEAIADSTLLSIAANQAKLTGGRIAGQAIQVPVAEAPGQTRVGRFGWKDQQGSLLSFAGDAYVNEQGITNRLFSSDTTNVCDNVPDIEDKTDPATGLQDIDKFASFIRSTKVPPRDTALASTPDAQQGAAIFHAIGCDICHVSSITTAPAGTAINGGAFTVPQALGNKVIHPYSDFLLHNVGTGDGIVQNGPQNTAYKLRTPPLWGMRTKSRLMHDLLSATRQEAILRHGGEAIFVTNNYRALTMQQKAQLIAFLNSL
ncbi:MAG TPA: di-heme oxidoredictase family protein [Candidatus Angelobacter sp.]|nr:di-heme oxidoredictase family protein [Candidatus Angelobacter sp.]